MTFAAITDVPAPTNEPVHEYAQGSPERGRITAALKELSGDPIDLPHVIGGKHAMGAGDRIDVVQPHRHSAVLGTLTNAGHSEAAAAVEAAIAAKDAWAATPFDERAAVFLRAADLLAGPWREKLAAATMLGQSKTVYQAEIDASCELVDFWRFNVAFARDLMAQQPISSRGVWNRTDYRPLEGFVYAITPFNFTAIAGNLPSAPALMGMCPWLVHPGRRNRMSGREARRKRTSAPTHWSSSITESIGTVMASGLSLIHI